MLQTSLTTTWKTRARFSNDLQENLSEFLCINGQTKGNSFTYNVLLVQLRYSVAAYYTMKNYRGLSPNYRGKRWAYVHLIEGSANYPIILHYEECKCAYLYMLINEASMNKKK